MMTIASHPPPTRKLRIIAQDPAVRSGGEILTDEVEIPAEALDPGPRGYRVQVVDFDASTSTLYRPLRTGLGDDPFRNASSSRLVADPHFHALNVYAIVMRTLARFEYALGRRVAWGFSGHQIQVAPHAFADANAFYSDTDRALMFGYFPGLDGKMVFSCLSHDVVAHETTHALVDGLRSRYTDPSSPDQAAFHEGFADVVALLSIFSLPKIVGAVLRINGGNSESRWVRRGALTAAELRKTALFGLAEQMGREMAEIRGSALRRSAQLAPSAHYLKDPEFQEPHRRGEVFVAAFMNSFLGVWLQRLKGLGEVRPGLLDRSKVVEEGASAATHLLTMSIRALDYCPPTDVQFPDFLSALLTADWEIQPDDSRYHYRDVLRATCASYGIRPASSMEGGYWEPPQGELVYTRTHFESMQRDPDEVFRFVWENRSVLGLCEDAYSRVHSVRPCLRIGPDGFPLRETVVEYIQILKLRARELARVRIRPPKGMPRDQEVTLYGGGALIFDEYGRLKFHVRNSILNARRQAARLDYLWKSGFFHQSGPRLRFAALHRQRVLGQPLNEAEAFDATEQEG